MKIGLRLFLSSFAFAVTLATTYWFVAHEITGTFLLGFMAFGLAVIAGYSIVGERDADLWGDRHDALPADAARSVLGTYTVRSPLPFWSALAVACLLVSLVLSPTIAVLAFVAILALAVAFVIQSR